MQRILILGIDGYLGWSLAQYLTEKGYEVGGIDNFLRRRLVEWVGGHSVTPILPIEERLLAFKAHYHKELWFRRRDMRDYQTIYSTLKEFQPEGIVHFAEIPSAPWSMASPKNATRCFDNNVSGTLNLLFAMREVCPEANLIKLGTLGEWGTPPIDLPEGYFEIEYHGRKAKLPFPAQPPSFYHATKVADTINIRFAAKAWGLRGIDIMQGPVFGLRIGEEPLPEPLLTRYDADAIFGTAINRFMAQAVIGHPLTPYGWPPQYRAWLPLQESMECLTLALENPPPPGTWEIFNQFNQVIDVYTLAEMVKEVAEGLGLKTEIGPVENVRLEQPQEYYNPLNEKLRRLGYRPRSREELKKIMKQTMEDLLPYAERIRELDREGKLLPDIWWDGRRKRAEFISVPSS